MLAPGLGNERFNVNRTYTVQQCILFFRSKAMELEVGSGDVVAKNAKIPRATTLHYDMMHFSQYAEFADTPAGGKLTAAQTRMQWEEWLDQALAPGSKWPPFF